MKKDLQELIAYWRKRRQEAIDELIKKSVNADKETMFRRLAAQTLPH